MAPPIVQSQRVTFRYGGQVVALAELDLAIEAGEFVLLAGGSGSGKSTLCRLLNGLIPHLHAGELAGTSVVDGHDVRVTPPYVLSRSVGLLLQQPDAQCFGSTVARDLAFGPAAQGWDRETVKERVRAAAALLDITHLLERAPHTLSGGEQQRVALAGVWALRPKLLLLDEPFAFLDGMGAEQLRGILRRLHREGVTIVVAEHRLAEIAAEATRMVVLQAGRVVADGPPREVLAQDVGRWGLEAPPVQLFRAAHRPETPLTLEEAMRLCDIGQILEAANAARPAVQAPEAVHGMPIVEWDNVWFSRGLPGEGAVLRGVDLDSSAGTVVAILGANGAGKTTLLQHANGLLRPQRGVVRVLGRPIGRRPVAEIARDVGLVVQQPAHMLFAPTVQDEIEAGPRALRRQDPAWRTELVERFALEPLLGRVPQRLSAGEQRRVALAAVLASRPRALLLDEPTVGQDATGRRTLGALLHAMARDGTSVVLATHDTEWAYPLSTRWAVLADGRIAGVDTPAAICEREDLVARARLQLPAIAVLRCHSLSRQDGHVLRK